MTRVSRILQGWEGMLVVAMTSMLAVFTVVVSYQVFSRYVEFIPRFFWTEEISRFSFIWMLFLGAAVAVRRSSHFVIDVVPQEIQARFGRLPDALVLVAIMVCAFFMVYGGVYFFEMGMKRISTVSGIRLAWIYLAIPVSGASIIAFVVEKLWALGKAPSARENTDPATTEPPAGGGTS